MRIVLIKTVAEETVNIKQKRKTEDGIPRQKKDIKRRQGLSCSF